MPFEGLCNFCHKRRMVAVNRKTGANCCNTCYIRHFQPRWRCAGCGSVRQARFVVDEEAGVRLCAACYASQINTATCSECGAKDAPIHHRSAAGKPICTVCYHENHQRRRRVGRSEPTEHQRDALAEMKRIATERGGWCLSDTYEDAQTPLRWRCRYKHEWESAPVTIKQGAWCSACSGTARLSIEMMRELAAERGGECLSPVYKSLQVALRWMCSKGHVWTARPDSIRAGQWCPDCGGTRRLSIEEMKELARERGGACLSDAYVRLSEPLRWRCAKGHDWTASAASVKTGGAWCPACAGVSKPTLADLRAHARKLGGQCLATEYRRGMEPVTWRCDKGHSWSAPWSRIRAGTWCPDCGRERLRRPKPRKTLEDMQAYAARLGGRCLSRYYINSSTKLLWECAEGHVFEAVQSSVARGHWCPECSGARSGSLAEFRVLARQRGGDCVSTEYRGTSAPYRWRCAEGHEWVAVARRVRHGTWCPLCSNRLPLDIAAMDELARSRGGECLSRIYVNSQTHMRWRCAEGHEWEAIPASIRRGTWCPVCAVDKRVARTAAARRPR